MIVVSRHLSRNLITRPTFIPFIRTCSSKISERPPSSDELHEYRYDQSSEIVQSDLEDYRVPMEPFVKNLFRGKFDTTVLAFADVLDNQRYHNVLDRCDQIRKTLEEKKDLVNAIDHEGKVSKDILLSLRSLGLYGLRDSMEFGGQNLTATETALLLEQLSTNMSLSETVSSSQMPGYAALRKCGTPLQKQKYMSKLASGQWSGAFCIADSAAGTDPDSTSVKAAYDDVDKTYTLNGTKHWVTNGSSANLFTVFANAVRRDYSSDIPVLTAFLVERDFEGVSVGERDPKSGMRGLDTCQVKFDNVVVPEENVIYDVGSGGAVVMDATIEDRVFTAARITAALRVLYDFTLKHTIKRKTFGHPLCGYDVIKYSLGKMASQIYALEATVYLTAGLMDYQKDPDVGLESTIAKLQAVKMGKEITDSCLQILGVLGYLEDEPARLLAEDLRAYDYWEGTTHILKAYVGMSGCIHLADHENKIRELRNPLMYPVESLRRFGRMRRHQKDNPKLTLKLGEYVHPTLCYIADSLEYCVHRFEFVTERVLVRHGYNVQMAGADLERLADIASDIYIMTCAISRANRAYCQGIANAQHDLYLAAAFANQTEDRIKLNVKDCLFKSGQDPDKFFNFAADLVLSKGKYCFEHPITKNIF